MSFEVKNTEISGKPCYQFCGQIDEEVVFPVVDNMPGEVVIDLEKVSSINSVGIRAWIEWFSQFEQTHFSFLKCPKSMVMQMNMVEGFLPEKSDVLSLEVPFYCEDCDEEKGVLFEVGKEIIIENGQVSLHYDKSSICPDSCDPELDVSEVKFFRFLLNKNDSAAA
jgi:hypothetical protein